MCLSFVKTVVVIIKSTEVPLNTLHKCIVIALRAGGVTPFYRLYRCVRRQREWFFSRFGLKKGINFDQFGLDMFFQKQLLLHH